MKHFDDIEWLLYKKDLLSTEKKIEMEEHLYNCDECMEIFTSLITENEIEKASELIPVNFTKKVLLKTKDIKIFNNKKSKPLQRSLNDFFIHYVAVALVAVVLTGGGYFGTMIDSVPKIDEIIDVKDSKIKANSIYNFSEKITYETSVFLNNFNLKKEDE